MHRALWCVLLGACLHSDAVVCESGRICPTGTVCDDAAGICVEPSAVAACNGKNDNDLCDAVGTPGSCVGGTCIPIVCGNGIVQPNEACDDGNRADGDGCRGDCLSDETCGNGIVDYQLGEQCDCGRDDATLAAGCTTPNSVGGFCGTDCKLSCGDGQVGPGEVCDGAPPPAQTCLDYGFDRGGLACSPVCSPGFADCGFVGWQRVAVTAHTMYGIWGSSASDVFLVGDQGAIVHFDGEHATDMSSPVSGQLRDAWGTGPSDVFVVGNVTPPGGGTVLHYDGTAWTVMTSPSTTVLVAISGTASNDVWAVGGTSIIHYDGAHWTSQTAPASIAAGLGTISDVWAVSPTLAFASASVTSPSFAGKLLAYDGVSWTVVSTTAGMTFTTVYATSAANVYIGTEHTSPPYNVDVLHYTGPVGTPATSIGQVGTQFASSMWGFGDHEVDVLSNVGDHVRWDGQLLTASVVDPSEAPTVIWGPNAHDLFGLSRSGSGAVSYLFRFSGDEWTTFQQADNGSIPSELIGFAPDDIYWLGGDADNLDHWNGTAWSAVLDLSAMGNDCKDLWLTDLNNVFIVGDAKIGHYAPAFTSYTPPHVAHAIWGAAAANVFAVGDLGGVYHFTGAWAPMASPVSAALYDVWGTSGTDVFAVGDAGTIVHYDGGSWLPMTSPTTAPLHAVWGSSPTDVFAVGDGGAIVHYDGAAWTAMDSGTLLSLEGIGGMSATDVYATGIELTVLHYDGTSWTPIRSPMPPSVEAWTSISAWPNATLIGGTNDATWLRDTP